MTDNDTVNRPDWTAAARRLLGDDLIVRSDADRTVAIGDTTARVRLWPPDATIEHVRTVRALHDRVPDRAGVPAPVGNVDVAVLVGGRVFDACTVLEGLPLNRHGMFTVEGYGAVAIPLHETADHGDILAQAARLLGMVHQASRDHIDQERTGAFSARDLHTATRLSWQEARKSLGRQAEALVEVRRWLRCGNRVIPIADDRLRAAGDDATGTPVLIHGDIWPARLMVDEPSRPRTLHGIDGWTMAAAGSPVIDVAALCARITGWSAANVEAVLGAYSEHADLSPGARRLVPVVAAVDLLNQLGRLLEIAFLDDWVADDPAQPFVRGGIAVLLRSLEHLTDVLAPPEPGGRGPGGPRRGGPPRTPPGRTRASGRSPRPSGRRPREAG
ncbi:MAG TPA: aminoglycoside phosphotransferase family protein [Thermomicrobiales bacterium]|nr:aminoglycoside phosphotransferase family protein [Thermomicrobiales bacterium]